MLFLFVEDDENIAAAFADLAASLGHHADVACSGGEALRMTGQTRYDTVFMDIGLPDIMDASFAITFVAPVRRTKLASSR
ncbi:two-component regulator histidine sensor kinase [Caballeronia arvi]|uniref:Two-component regulator histidine sensor kinase n=1 Tax=Caballeronia arvi TaxID=1777135 RepID=A0A158L1P1_9BURK|nr:response regulator [Caballeronia arvi]SAL86873.1 two-component regulator histidine sensor kinase [Caballeronia arvi]